MNPQSGLRNRDERLPEQTRQRPVVAPPVDIYENPDEVLLVADVPGATRESITIDLHQDQLTLLARRAENGAQGRNAGNARDYYRSFLVPQGIDGARIAAELSNGVLRVRLPKAEAAKPRRIEVRAG